MYAITGATGHTGGVITDKLLASGSKVRVIGRDIKRLEKFSSKGAEAVVADMTDSAALEKAFSGARAVYALIPPNISAPDVRAYQERVTDALADAVRKAGVPYAVVLSSYGADKSYGVGPVIGLNSLEKKLGAIGGLNAVFLRAGYFMENTLAQIGIIQSLGFMGTPLRADLALPMIATQDIGTVAAELLAKLDFSGKQTRELQGARDIAYTEVAKIVGANIGRTDLTYRQVSATQVRPALLQMGMSANMADLLLEMIEALNAGHMKALEPRSPNNTTPTTFEKFAAEEFAPAYRGKAARA